MKKFGFTLAELLVTIGIIGVVTAITIPMLSNVRPDKDKLMVLKTYKILVDTNKELLSNPSFYLITDDCEGLECDALPIDPEIRNLANSALYSGGSKYAMLLARSLDTDVQPHIFANLFIHFSTNDGVDWFIPRQPANQHYLVTIGTDGVNSLTTGHNYNRSAENPNLFSFSVSTTDGSVVGADSLTQAYLENPRKLNDKKKDYSRAAAIKAGSR